MTIEAWQSTNQIFVARAKSRLKDLYVLNYRISYNPNSPYKSYIKVLIDFINSVIPILF